MMDDHLMLSAARNHLCDALKVLLNPDIMDKDDFRRSRALTALALGYLDELLRQPDRDKAQPGPTSAARLGPDDLAGGQVEAGGFHQYSC